MGFTALRCVSNYLEITTKTFPFIFKSIFSIWSVLNYFCCLALQLQWPSKGKTLILAQADNVVNLWLSPLLVIVSIKQSFSVHIFAVENHFVVSLAVWGRRPSAILYRWESWLKSLVSVGTVGYEFSLIFADLYKLSWSILRCRLNNVFAII